MEEQESRHTVWLPENAWEAVEGHYRIDNCTTKNEYIEMGIAFFRKVWYMFVLPKGGSKMRDYMTALHDRFRIASEKSMGLAEKVETAYDELHTELSREQQRLLLRFIDVENSFREEATLDSFISGYRLAEGIHGELNALPRFSIAVEDEERARKIFEMEWGEKHGETPGER